MKRRVVIILLLVGLAGCMPPEKGLHIYPTSKLDSSAAEAILEKDDRVTRANIIIHHNHIITGIVIKTFSRFQKEKIEVRLTEQFQKAYPHADITISADHKIVYQTSKMLKEKAEGKKLDEAIQKIQSLLKEET